MISAEISRRDPMPASVMPAANLGPELQVSSEGLQLRHALQDAEQRLQYEEQAFLGRSWGRGWFRWGLIRTFLHKDSPHTTIKSFLGGALGPGGALVAKGWVAPCGTPIAAPLVLLSQVQRHLQERLRKALAERDQEFHQVPQSRIGRRVDVRQVVERKVFGSKCHLPQKTAPRSKKQLVRGYLRGLDCVYNIILDCGGNSLDVRFVVLALRRLRRSLDSALSGRRSRCI